MTDGSFEEPSKQKVRCTTQQWEQATHPTYVG